MKEKRQNSGHSREAFTQIKKELISDLVNLVLLVSYVLWPIHKIAHSVK